jgi:hypothetical protein
MTRVAPPVQSPCNSVCRIDERSGLCLGCWRTLDEIAAWSTLDEAHKRALCAELRVRRREARAQTVPQESAK